MEAVQGFEQELKSLAVYKEERPSDLSIDDAWKRVEKLLRAPLGHLAHALPADLRENFVEIRRLRNHLAHEALVLWRFERNVGIHTDEEWVDWLLDYESKFRSLSDVLAPMAAAHLESLGIHPDDYDFSAEEIRRMALGDMTF